MKTSPGFRRLGFIATAATYLLIFVGGLVRVSGAGLGCPDWPHCFGRWFPPTSIDQLPPEIDPAQFNFVLAWIEYSNRLLGMTIGLLIAAFGIWAIVRYRQHRSIVVPAAAAALLTAFQGWQGAVVVASDLRPIIVSVHMLLALIIVSLLTYATHKAYLAGASPVSAGLKWTAGRWWLRLLWVVALIQVVLGVKVRESLEHISAQFPLMSEVDRLSEVGVLNHIHLGNGMILVALTWLVAALLMRHNRGRSTTIARGAGIMVLLVTIQLFLGLTFLAIGRTAVMQLFHLLIASLYIGTLVVVYSAAKPIGGDNE